MTRHKYTKELLEEAAKDSKSVRDVMRYLGLALNGGNSAHMGKRLKHFGVDTSHFTGQAHGKGKVSLGRLKPEQILIVRPSGAERPKASQLRRALIESGMEYKCVGCRLTDQWNGASIVLEVDHIDGDWLNNLIENLRFLCPNCHSQQETNRGWKNKKQA